jgi:hypothetical protein
MKNVIPILFLILIIYIIYSKYDMTAGKYKCNMNIIVPIRDREKELEEFIENILHIFGQNNINYRLYIIEQSDKKEFNRGKLLNIGFLEASKDNFAQHYYISDIDIYPRTHDTFNLECVDGFTHLYGLENTLGGVFTVDKDSFKLVNGFSNEFYGWGLDDDLLLYRINTVGAKINKEDYIQRYSDLVIDTPSPIDYLKKKKDTYSKNKDLFEEYIKSYKLNKNNIYKDGLQNCDYKIIKKNIFKKPYIIRYMVDV